MTSTTAPAVDLTEVDLTDPSWFRDGPPHELFARMRAETPIRWNETEHFGGFWSLTRAAEIAAVSRDTATFSSHAEGVFVQRDQVAPLDLVRAVLLYKDPPEHTKYRKILQSAFVPATVAKMEDDIRAVVTRVLDDVIEQGACDWTQDVAVRVPLLVLAELMGIPEDDVPRLYEWTEQIEAAQRAIEPAQAVETFMAMAMYLHEQVERQAAEGNSDSLVMRLRAAEVDGETLADPEIMTFFALLVFAGNDTTRNTTSGGLLALLEHPEQLEKLRADPAVIPQAVEEILRWTSVVNYFVRTATTDTELAGQPIAAGEKVMLWYASGSRDEAKYADPQTFDVTRSEHDHMAFGGGGRHFCLGAGLARLELRIIFEETTRRLHEIEQAGEVQRLQSSWANGLTSLPIRFRAGARVG
ncbi:putative cytochrome P450 hydroxylase [Patulibacter medicamentivorans]|uniref:Putative cytochrome P450 hydroxylase n=1 Tax=Patulibacter medicamentivorans TaxID=1097667 RepID=H0E6Q9_9ACTN|nr:cytochrome P450 [Patulibacter medicamentivorans]EHN10622.1 putative cytochrome P450 hydroxylase [Patulibacter medicamentivorans]